MIKRLFFMLFSLILLFAFQSFGMKVESIDEKINLIVDGCDVQCNYPPIIDGEDVLIPVKTFSETIGAEIEWVEDIKKIGLHTCDTSVEMRVNYPFISINGGNIVEIQTRPKIIESEIYVPLIECSEVFGVNVSFASETNTMYLDYFSIMSGNIYIGGANNLINVSQRVVDILIEMNPDFRAIALGGGNSYGVMGCLKGEFHIGSLSRKLSPDEGYYYPDLIQHPIAMEGIAVIVNPQNPAGQQNFGSMDIANIFSGKITNWSVYKGNNEAIFVNIHEAGSATLNTFYESGIIAADEKADFASTAMPHASNGLVKQAVASEPKAVGIVSFPYIDETVTALNDPKPEKLFMRSIFDHVWPYKNDIIFITYGKPYGAVAKFINFLRTPKGRQILEEEGFVNLESYGLYK